MTATLRTTTHVVVRGYEIDALGHIAHTVYMQYAEHARWERMAAAGLDVQTLLQAGVMPIMMETTLVYRKELRFGDEAEIGCEFEWGTGKTARVSQPIHRGDGVLSAEVTSVAGLLDLSRRKLVEAPIERLRELATAPELLGI
ncbi:acyl-CoA thioesterase [Pseudonocardia sp. 73-21]|uniref:acyl-CoA thioesterase n=1 Tax=Pseudonocardia sp. 73-21 TaxID=1895809 RepID=UPI000963B5B7|nr:acyl-CoA thioesterase [Pseudonocardia sp. 73-21]OJY38477.1 MAG: thioesterase [Pseudonocardia sp. 73-21]